MEYVILIISAVLIKNILLAQYLGNCPFLGTSKRMDIFDLPVSEAAKERN